MTRKANFLQKILQIMDKIKTCAMKNGIKNRK